MRLYILAFVIAALCWLLAYFYKLNRGWLNPIGWAWYLAGVVTMLISR